ncbi:MAG: prepilin peptidase [Candidatus Brocadiia bacterium]
MLFIVIFIFGLLIGSFLNVCIYRLPRGKCKSCGHVVTTDEPVEACPKCNSKSGFRRMSIVSPGSHCPSCNKPIRWYQNIPLFSYIFLLGRCAGCRTRISFRYPLVELLTGLLFALAAWQNLGPQAGPDNIIKFMIYIWLVAALIIITFIDIDLRIIPDEISIPGIILAPIVSAIFPFLHPALFIKLPAHLDGFVSSLLGMIAGGGVVYLVGVVGKLVFKKDAMGFGDVKLMIFLGGFLGWYAILFTFILGCILGAIFGVISYFVTKDHYIAFGPYLALGALLMLFFRPQIVDFVIITYPQFIRNLLLS